MLGNDRNEKFLVENETHVQIISRKITFRKKPNIENIF